MKKVVNAIILAIVMFIGIIYWHGTEQRRWSEWRLIKLYQVDLIQAKINEGWPEDSIQEYEKSIEDSFKIDTPIDCPYCQIQKLLR